MTIDVKQEKKLKSLENEIDIDNVSLDAEWETNSDMYKYITADLAIFESAKEADEFYTKCKSGDIDFSGLDESRVQLGFGEKIYINDNRLSDSLENKIKENVVKCYTVEGYPIVLIVDKRAVSKKSLLKDIEDNLKKIKAQEILQLEFDEFRDSLDIKIETEEVKIKEW
jgi:hypothetical protein